MEKQEGNQMEFEPNSDELIDSIWLKNERTDLTKEGIMLFFVHLFFGFGMFYINPGNNRKWIYPILAIFAWFSFANVFVRAIPDMEEFQNKTLLGALTIMVAWFIVYGIGYFDVYRELYLKSKRIDRK